MTGSDEQDNVSMSFGKLSAGTLNIESILHAATACNEEVQQLLLGECDAILECKICRELFRSMNNFIKHKKLYCKTLLKETQDRSGGSLSQEECMSLDELCCGSAERGASPDSCLHNSSDGSDFAVSLGPGSRTSYWTVAGKQNMITSQIALERIAGNNNAVYQTISTSAQGQTGTVSDTEPEECPDAERRPATFGTIDRQSPGAQCQVPSSARPLRRYGLLCSRFGKRKNANPVSIVVAQRNGVTLHTCVVAQQNSSPVQAQRASRGSSPRPQSGAMQGRMDTTVAASALKRSSHWQSIYDLATLSCARCKVNFANIKDLHRHMVIFHPIKKVFYRCFYCSSVFSQQWGVKRHMMRAHGKSKEEIEAVRGQLKKKACTNLGSVTALKLSQTSNDRLAAALPHIDTQEECKSAASDSAAAWQSSASIGTLTRLDCTSADIPAMLAPKKKLDLHACSICSKIFGSSALMRKHREFCSGAVSLTSSGDVAGTALPSIGETLSSNRTSSDVEQSLVLPTAEEAPAGDASPNVAGIALPRSVASPPSVPLSPSSLSSLAVCRSRRQPKPNRLFLDTSDDEGSGLASRPLSLFRQILGARKPTKKAFSAATPVSTSRAASFCASDDLTNKQDAKEEGLSDQGYGALAAANDSVLDGSSAEGEAAQGEAMSAKPVAHHSKRRASSKVSVLAKDEMEGVLDVGTLSCLICQKQFSTTFNLHRHARRHCRKKRFKCRQCGFTSHDKSDCSVHVRKCHMLADSLLRPTLETYIVDLGEQPISPPSQSSDETAIKPEPGSSS